MRDLICEGVCNPTLPQFDAAAGELAETRRREALRQLVPPSLVEAQLISVMAWRSTLRHTPHRHIAGNRWACGTCGAERKYGAALDVPSQWSWGRQTASQRANRRAS